MPVLRVLRPAHARALPLVRQTLRLLVLAGESERLLRLPSSTRAEAEGGGMTVILTATRVLRDQDRLTITAGRYVWRG